MGSIPCSPKVILEYFFVNFGMSWDVSGSGLATFSNGFGIVVEKRSDAIEKFRFSKMAGIIVPESGYLEILFRLLPAQNLEILKNAILLYFYNI